MSETRYQRIAREQAERQAARAQRRDQEGRALTRQLRQRERWARQARTERKWHETLVSDFYYDD